MQLREAVKLAVHSLRTHRLRSVLTTLGIVIGVAAVVVLVGLGNGMKAGFDKSFGPFATQMNISKIEGHALGGAARNLTDSDVTRLAEAPDVASVTPVAGATTVVTVGHRKYQSTVSGSTTDYLSVANLELAAGTMFTAAQQRAGAKVVVLGSDIVANLLPGPAAAAVGERVRIARTGFTVIGVLAQSGQSDDAAVMPYTAARDYLVGRDDDLHQIVVRARGADRVGAARAEVEHILDAQHHIADPSRRDYKLQAFESQVAKFNQMLRFLTLFVVAIAGISLLVGGIGVANIMLVSVTERTREIGIRKAIGARRSAIMKQFLIEAVTLAGLGGLVGEVLGAACTLGAAALLARLAPKFGTPSLAPEAIGISMLVSLVIGLVAGGYPALRASKLRPVEALRHQ